MQLQLAQPIAQTVQKHTRLLVKEKQFVSVAWQAVHLMV
jgi:hypothetical protein